MLDSFLKPHTDKVLDKLAAALPGNAIGSFPIILGFVLSLCGCFTIAMGNYVVGLILFLIGRVVDAAAGRAGSSGDFTDYLRITLEWILYAGFVFFFALSATTHYMAATILLFGYVTLAVSALAYKVIAAKRGQIDDEAAMLLFHPARLVERTEILAFIVISCLIPAAFSAFAMLFALLVIVTAGGWIFKARQNF